MGKIIVAILFLFIQPGFGQVKRHEKGGFKNQIFTAKVIRIIDGDSMEVLYRQQPIQIRLAHIDCPELKKLQPYSGHAKKALSDLCFAQQVIVHIEKYDRYGRIIAVVANAKKQVVNQEMIKRGMAWHFKRYSTNIIYANLEVEAKKNKIGLWKDPHSIAPWEWRKPKRK